MPFIGKSPSLEKTRPAKVAKEKKAMASME